MDSYGGFGAPRAPSAQPSAWLGVGSEEGGVGKHGPAVQRGGRQKNARAQRSDVDEHRCSLRHLLRGSRMTSVGVRRAELGPGRLGTS